MCRTAVLDSQVPCKNLQGMEKRTHTIRSSVFFSEFFSQFPLFSQFPPFSERHPRTPPQAYFSMRNPILSSIWPHFVILLVFFRFLLVGRRDVGLDGACLETREAVVSGRLSRERSPLCGPCPRPLHHSWGGVRVCACGGGVRAELFFSGATTTSLSGEPRDV